VKRLVYLMAVALGLSLTGCVSFTPLGPIGDPVEHASTTLKRGAQINEVVISAPQVNDTVRANASRQLTDQISNYVEKSDYFNKVVVFPVKAGEDDVILKFDLTSLSGKRTPHPGYFPGALLTLTMWIWVNGPIYVDDYDLAGTLVIEDRNGRTLAKASEQIKFDQNTGFWDDDYFSFTLGAHQLRDLIAHLMAKATPQLSNPSTQVATHE